MKAKAEPIRGDAYKAVSHVYRTSHGRSWTRLNGALYDTLSAAITARLSVLPEDFAAIARDHAGGYWMGSGDGSNLGERFYVLAVKCGHTPAAISFENWAGRPAALWCETSKTPDRLCVGSNFTWEGITVSVTSMKTDHLIACTHKRSRDQKLAEGGIGYIAGEYREVEYLKRDQDRLLLRFGPVVPYETRKIDRRFAIPYAELTAKRREADAIRRAALLDISKAENPAGLSAIETRLSSALVHGVYRHFDIEDFRKAIEAKRESFTIADNEIQRKIDVAQRAAERAASLERWVAGEDITGFWNEVRLRVKGDCVQTSKGQSATVKGVLSVLPVVLNARRRKRNMEAVLGQMVDMHRVAGFSDAGIRVGCTLIPWPEVEKIAKTLRVKC